MMLSDFFEMDLSLLCMHFKLHINSVITFLVLKYLARKGLGNLALVFNVLEKKTCFFPSVYWETFDIGSKILQNEEKKQST